MAKEGRLTKRRFGFNLPLDAPLYSSLPIIYNNVEAISFTYETDEDAALDILPEGLELSSPATAGLMFVKYPPPNGLGAYEEAILAIYCTWQGEPRIYLPYLIVNSDIPLAAGREIWGFPKKLGHVSFEKEGDMVWGAIERPAGNRICTGVMRTQAPVTLETVEQQIPVISLRVIPSPEEGAEPSLAELIEIRYDNDVSNEVWEGPGSVQFHSTSSIDPWHRLGVNRMLNATYRRYHQELGHGRIVKSY